MHAPGLGGARLGWPLKVAAPAVGQSAQRAAEFGNGVGQSVGT